MKSHSKSNIHSSETQRLLELVRKEIHSVVPGAEIILYGSRARGDAMPTSDWDFLILLDRPIDRALMVELKNRLYDLELATDTIISSIIRTKKEWQAPQYNVLPFKHVVEQEGIPL